MDWSCIQSNDGISNCLRATHCLLANFELGHGVPNPQQSTPRLQHLSKRQSEEQNLCPLHSVLRHDQRADSSPKPLFFFIEKFMSFVLNTRAMKIFYSHTMLRNILKTIHMACGLPSVCRPVFTWVCAEPEGQSLFQCISDGVISEEVVCDFQHLLIRRQHKNKNSRF